MRDVELLHPIIIFCNRINTTRYHSSPLAPLLPTLEILVGNITILRNQVPFPVVSEDILLTGGTGLERRIDQISGPLHHRRPYIGNWLLML
jgi:hypothetical protein